MTAADIERAAVARQRFDASALVEAQVKMAARALPSGMAIIPHQAGQWAAEVYKHSVLRAFPVLLLDDASAAATADVRRTTVRWLDALDTRGGDIAGAELLKAAAWPGQVPPAMRLAMDNVTVAADVVAPATRRARDALTGRALTPNDAITLAATAVAMAHDVSVTQHKHEYGAVSFNDAADVQRRRVHLAVAPRVSRANSFVVPASASVVYAYTDGAAQRSADGRRDAGAGVHYVGKPVVNGVAVADLAEPVPGMTNNGAELTAATLALLNTWTDVVVFTDSTYANQTAMLNTRTANTALWRRMWHALRVRRAAGLTTHVLWVKGHVGNRGNEAADKLAGAAMRLSSTLTTAAERDKQRILAGISASLDFWTGELETRRTTALHAAPSPTPAAASTSASATAALSTPAEPPPAASRGQVSAAVAAAASAFLAKVLGTDATLSLPAPTPLSPLG